MTRRTLSIALLTALGTVATQGAAMSKKDPKPIPTKPSPRPFEDPH